MEAPPGPGSPLTDADEFLLHQTGRPLSIAAVSDHRHFDRHWFGVWSPGGEVAVILGMGCYKNMNVMDGFLTVHRLSDHRQFNLRTSRVLRPDAGTTHVGPLSVEVVEPWKRLRLRVEPNAHGLACDLAWNAAYPPHLEAHTVHQVGGTVVSDSTRYDQAASVTGWVEVEGRRHAVDGWWGGRDHSWGVRPGVGGFEPARTNDAAPSAPPGGKFFWSLFSTSTYSCQFQAHEDALGATLHVDGSVHFAEGSGRPSLRVVDVERRLDIGPGRRLYDKVGYKVRLSDGGVLAVEATPLLPAWAYSGTGYDGGYFDRKGLGAQRGDGVVEYDVYDLSEPETVRDLNGAPIFPGHREQPAIVRVNGETCIGHCPVMIF